MNRRQFTAASLAAAATTVLPTTTRATAAPQSGVRYAAFIKYLQSLSYEELAEAIVAAGFDGIEATVRQGGYILPENAPAELPKLHKALAANGLELTIVTTDILAADQPHAENLLAAAVELGVPRYRLGFFRYDLAQPILPQLDALRPVIDQLAALNRRLEITGMIQNHAGAHMVGATIWDLYSLIKDHPPEEVGCVYDIRHAAVEAGEAWPVPYDVIKPHIIAMYAKDFTWKGRRSASVALGTGQVDPQFFQTLSQSDYDKPISVHVEYLERQGVEKNLTALATDLKTLRSWMKSA
jgi:sugar phosphate isomerase/epimerase